MSGPGDARFDGTVDTATAQLTGSGSLDGHRLATSHTEVDGARSRQRGRQRGRQKGADNAARP